MAFPYSIVRAIVLVLTIFLDFEGAKKSAASLTHRSIEEVLLALVGFLDFTILCNYNVNTPN